METNTSEEKRNATFLKDTKCGPRGGSRSEPVRGGGRARKNKFIRQLNMQGYKYSVDEFDFTFRVRWWEDQK